MSIFDDIRAALTDPPPRKPPWERYAEWGGPEEPEPEPEPESTRTRKVKRYYPKSSPGTGRLRIISRREELDGVTYDVLACGHKLVSAGHKRSRRCHECPPLD